MKCLLYLPQIRGHYVRYIYAPKNTEEISLPRTRC